MWRLEAFLVTPHWWTSTLGASVEVFSMWGDLLKPAPRGCPQRSRRDRQLWPWAGLGVTRDRRGEAGPGRCEGPGAGRDGPEDRDPQREPVATGRRTGLHNSSRS